MMRSKQLGNPTEQGLLSQGEGSYGDMHKNTERFGAGARRANCGQRRRTGTESDANDAAVDEITEKTRTQLTIQDEKLSVKADKMNSRDLESDEKTLIEKGDKDLSDKQSNIYQSCGGDKAKGDGKSN
ncbi:unnamed protein product [Anisakis simplex]|uniref:Uncharacterized protein n=1 Tax=Anisakis simplex TaxID=6269 RepID=A0A0M3KF93_ANISI|nr:unnamed protein product [Anisakis simplex]